MAKGIPDFKDFGKLEDMGSQVGETLKFVRQLHAAERAGLHEDWRFASTPDNKLMHSWAVPKGEPSGRARHLAIRQPMHAGSYAKFKGEIKSGYGKGKVETAELGKIKLNKATPNKIVFTVQRKDGNKTMALIKTPGPDNKKRQWILLNTLETLT